MGTITNHNKYIITIQKDKVLSPYGLFTVLNKIIMTFLYRHLYIQAKYKKIIENFERYKRSIF